MLRTKNLEMARVHAHENNLIVGFCVFDGWFYVGTAEQLERIGCRNP